MKKTLLSLLMIVLVYCTHAQQWTTSGTNIYNSNTGKVGIGTTNPLTLFHTNGFGSFGNKVTTANATRALNLADDAAVMRILRVHATNAPAIELISRTTADGANVAYWDFYAEPSDASFRIRDRQTGSNLDRFTIDHTNGYVGIGTTDPNYLLSLGSVSKGFAEYQAGSTTGDAIKAVANNIGSGFGVQNLNPSGYVGVEYIGSDGNVKAFAGYNNGNTGEFRFNNIAANAFYAFKINNSDKLVITNSGNVGIGTSNPNTYKLAVEGTVGVRKLKVTQVTPWSDYVFEPTYKLSSLAEVEAYIKANKHLPGVPSAKEVEKEGLDISDNQATLLKKIEELTLYVIELKKQLDEQKDTINQMRISPEKKASAK